MKNTAFTLISTTTEISNKYMIVRNKFNNITIQGKDSELLIAIDDVTELVNDCVNNNTCQGTFFDCNGEWYDFNLKCIYRLYNYIGIDKNTATNILDCTIGRNILDVDMFYTLCTKVLEKLIQTYQSNDELDLYLNSHKQLYISKEISNTTMFNIVKDLIQSNKCISTDLYITDMYDSGKAKNQLQGITMTIKTQFVDYVYNLMYDKTEDIAVLNIRDSYKGNREVNIKITTKNFLSQFKELQKIVINTQKRILESCLFPSEHTMEYLKEIFG